MDSGQFLCELAAELRRIGVEEAVITKRVGQFERYFDTMQPDEAAEMLAGLGDIEDIALNIKALSGRKKTPPAEPQPEPEPELKEESAGVGEEFDVFTEQLSLEQNAEKTIEFDLPQEREPVSEEETRYIDLNSLREAAREGTLPGAQNTEALYEETLLYVEEPFAEDQTYDAASAVEQPCVSDPEADPSAGSEYAYRHIELDFNELDDTESDLKPTAKGQAIFIVGALLTLPITLPLMLMVLLVIGAVFAAVSVLIAALIALLIVIVVAGVVIPLVGIIFGIIKAYTVFPVGLYEIGLGITIAGFAMFAGILVYNMAVRLLPFVLKKFSVFSRFVLRSIGKLVKRIRKECVTL